MGLLPGTVARGRAAWERLRARQTSDDRMREVLETPMLLRPEVLDIVVDRHEPDQVTLAGEVNSLAQDLRSQPFPLGLGPVEALWRSLHDGTLSEPEACVQARSLPVTENLVGPYVAELFAVLIAPATRPQTWRLARAQGRALVAALDACPDRPELALPGRLGQLEWTAALLTTVPDGALLAGADQLGRAMLENLPPEDLRTRGTIHRALAVLWGDPYVAGRSSAHAEQQDQTWRQRGAAEHAVDNRPWDDWRMPEAVDALTSSVEHWRVACSARPQDPRTIIGLVEAGLALAQRVGGDPPADVIEAARTGLGLAAEETTRARFSQAARILGLAATADVATFEMDRCDTDTLIARSGADVALSVLQRISGLEIDDPGQALRLALEHSELLAEPGALPPESFVIFVQLLVRLLNAAHGVPEATSGPEGSTSFLDHAHAVLDRVDSQSDRCAESLVATALQLAVQSSFVNAEADGLVLLESAVKIAPLFARRYAWVIDALRAVLMTGEAVNQHVAGNDSSAVRWYLLSMESWGRQRRVDAVADLLSKIANLAGKASSEALPDILYTAATMSATVDGATWSPQVSALESLLHGALGGMLDQGQLNSEMIWATLELAKGRRMAHRLVRRREGAREDPELGALLARLDEDDLATSGQREARARFQERWQAWALEGSTTLPFDSLEAVRHALDSRTVVAATGTAQHADGRLSRLAYLVWAEDAVLAATAPAAPGDLQPIPSGFFDTLDELAGSGKDHLCLLLDGELHAASWHTLELAGGLLADTWVTTLLPHPHLLVSDRGGGTIRSRFPIPVLSVGLDRAGPDWPTLPNAEAEAQAVADHYPPTRTSTPALLGPAATTAALRELAPKATNIHIATHGQGDSQAPAFHSIILADGTLHAWQVAELDLRQCDVVTLSACDTARITAQAADNFDGLPIAFLVAGARTVVGTSVEIDTLAAQVFFESFHRQLAAGVTDLRDVFREAQRTTRAAYPDPQTWGAFYLLGDWW